MSLNNEKLQQIIDVQKQTLELLKKTLDAVTTLKGEIDDKLEDNHKEVLEKIHALDTFCHNILEENQKTIWKKLLELEGKETEQEETEESTE